MQTGKVKVLREAYATGKIKKGELDRQEGLLQKMTVSAFCLWEVQLNVRQWP